VGAGFRHLGTLPPGAPIFSYIGDPVSIIATDA